MNVRWITIFFCGWEICNKYKIVVVFGEINLVRDSVWPSTVPLIVKSYLYCLHQSLKNNLPVKKDRSAACRVCVLSVARKAVTECHKNLINCLLA